MVRSSNPTTGRVRLEVIDSGIGIAPELLPQIFEPFCQGESGKRRRFGGLGLGLSIARGLVEAHGGTIEASSGEAKAGTTIAVEFDTITPVVQPASSSEDNSPHIARALRILLVEDHDDTRQVFSRMLKLWGHTVIVAGTVAQAISAAENAFDVLISDIGLPDGTGMDLLRGLGNRRPPYAIAVSGYGMNEDLEKSREAGFDQHFTKPISPVKLKEELYRLAALIETAA